MYIEYICINENNTHINTTKTFCRSHQPVQPLPVITSAFCFSNCNGSLNMQPADQSDLIPVSHFLKQSRTCAFFLFKRWNWLISVYEESIRCFHCLHLHHLLGVKGKHIVCSLWFYSRRNFTFQSVCRTRKQLPLNIHEHAIRTGINRSMHKSDSHGQIKDNKKWHPVWCQVKLTSYSWVSILQRRM